MDLKKYTLEELKELKTKVDQEIENFKDGYFYVCNIQAYGSNSDAYFDNRVSAEELYFDYNGDNGFCDLYTNNPNARIGQGYGGGVYYIESEEVYKRWKEYSQYKSVVANHRGYYKEDTIKQSRNAMTKMGQVTEPILYEKVKDRLIREAKIRRILK